MKILFITNSHNGLSQRAFVELRRRGHDVTLEFALNEDVMREAVALAEPDLILCPILTKRIPQDIWSAQVCLVVHPGIRGDRGASSLDWAILDGREEWGVTILQAVDEMDAGDIWAWETCPIRACSKSSLYRVELTEAAMRAMIRAVEKFQRGEAPAPLDYSNPEITGRPRPIRKLRDSTVDWNAPTTEVLRSLWASDSRPGAPDELFGQRVLMSGIHPEDQLRGQPGQIVATRSGAICRATGDGAVWITKLQRQPSGTQHHFKRAAAELLVEHLSDVPEVPIGLEEAAARPGTFSELRYEELDGVGYLQFDFHGGAMNTSQCERLRSAICHACARPTRVLTLMGGTDFWSNGIHLLDIEAAASPADESWRNINALNDVIREILDIDDRLVVAAMHGNAGAGGVILGLAADRVWAREGVVLNPHYKGMGGLYGSEYWTYLLPRRVGEARAQALVAELLPVSAHEALDMHLVDAVFPGVLEQFRDQVRLAATTLANNPEYDSLLADKLARRARDEQTKSLAAYREEELEHMRRNFYGEDPSYHRARQAFVCQTKPAHTPPHLARHRRR
jgi:putative two-component system hydrogenase maturation factor HypX/HoxX